ncbi:MAG: dTDP-4-dehydrorhamnose reductase, partial [Spirochaetota bacterium]
TELASALAGAGLPTVGTDREVDILDPATISAFAAGKDIRWLVNCAAYTAVDKAEDEEALALRLNAEGPENLARLATAIGARLLHISTDYVFPGTADSPIPEDAPVAPQGAYGRTKAEGERRVMAAAPDSVILRTAWLYGRHGPNFVYTMLRLMKEREKIGVVADQHGTPTSASDLSAAIVHLVTKPELPAGIYHYTNAGATTWYDFACEIHRLGRSIGLLEGDCTINPLSTAEYPTKAARPAYSVLSKEKVQALGVQVPGWGESLAGFLGNMTKYLHDMKVLAHHAVYDLETSKAMLASGRYLYVAFTCQQAIEKNLKVILYLNHTPMLIHNLARLASCSGMVFDNDDLVLLNMISGYYIKGQYQADVDELGRIFTEEAARKLFERGSALCGKIRKHPIFSIL